MIPRLYLNHDIKKGDTLTLEREHRHYLHHVLRRRAGDTVIVFNGRGGEFHARIAQLDHHQGALFIARHDPVSREMRTAVHVVQAACRNEKLEWMLQKSVELGAASIQLTGSHRATLRLPAQRRDKRLARWRKILVEASEQCGRTIVPTLRWHDRLHAIETRGLCLCLHPVSACDWPAMLPRLRKAREITLAIGPEGGWSDEDLTTLRGMGFEPLTFGPRILRAETAAPALLAAIQAIADSGDK